MLDSVFNTLTFETILVGIGVLIPLLALAVLYPEVVLALNLPVLLFIGQFKDSFPMSISAISSLLPVIAIIGGMLKGYRFRFGRIEAAFVVLVILVLFSQRYSRSPVYGTEKAVLVLGQTLPLVLAASYTLVSFDAIKRALNIISLSLLTYAVVALMIRLFADHEFGRFEGLGGPIFGARMNGWCAITCLYWWWPRQRALTIPILFLFLATIYLSLISGTRTVLLAIPATILAVLCLREKTLAKVFVNRSSRLFAAAWLSWLLFMVGQPLLSRFLPEDVYEVRFSTLEAFLGVGDLAEPSARVLYYTVACEALFESPLLGLGVGGFKDAYTERCGLKASQQEDERHPVYPHNIFLEFFCEQGVFGFLLFCVIIYYSVKILLRIRAEVSTLEKQHQQLAVAVCAFFIYGFIVAQTSSDIPRQHILWWALGMLAALSHLLESHARALATASRRLWQNPAPTHQQIAQSPVFNSIRGKRRKSVSWQKSV